MPRALIAALMLSCAALAAAACSASGRVLVVEGVLKSDDRPLRQVPGWDARVVRAAGGSSGAELIQRFEARWAVDAVPLLVPVEPPDTSWSPSQAGAVDASQVVYGVFTVDRVNAFLSDAEISVVLGPEWVKSIRFDAGRLVPGRSVTIEGRRGGVMSATVIDGRLYAQVDTGYQSVRIEPVQGNVHAMFESAPQSADRVIASSDGGAGAWPPEPFCEDDSLDIAIGLSSRTRFPYPGDVALVVEAKLREAFSAAGLSPSLRVTSREVSGVQAGDLEVDLLAVENRSDHNWDEFHDIPAADLSMLVVSASGPSDGTGLARIGATAAQRFAVVHEHDALGLTPIHEFGHLAGADHEPGLQTGPRLPYGLGHVDCRKGGSRTLMAWGSNCGHATIRRNVWSSINPPRRLGRKDVSEVDRLLRRSLKYVSSLSCASSTS